MADKIIDINKDKPHYTGELICLNCCHRGLHTWPADCWLQELECPDCHEVGYIIGTGQVLDYPEYEEHIPSNSKKVNKPGIVLNMRGEKYEQ